MGIIIRQDDVGRSKNRGNQAISYLLLKVDLETIAASAMNLLSNDKKGIYASLSSKQEGSKWRHTS